MINCYNYPILGFQWFGIHKPIIKHKAKVLTPKEVMEGRSNAYKFLDFPRKTLNPNKKNETGI